VALLPGVFSGLNSTWADFHGLGRVVIEAPVSKVHNDWGDGDWSNSWDGSGFSGGHFDVKVLKSCWLWVSAVSIFCSVGSSFAVSSPGVSGFFIIVVNWHGDWGFVDDNGGGDGGWGGDDNGSTGSCWLWVGAVSILCSVGSSFAVNGP